MPRKMQPAVKKMWFSYTHISSLNLGTIDLSLAASMVNRKFLRQGLNWAVANVRVIMTDNTDAGSITVLAAQDTWVTANAHTKAFAVWQEMNKHALKEVKSIKPKYHDFKVFLDGDHENEYTASIDAGGPGYQTAAHPDVGILAPLNGITPNQFYTGGEWEYPTVITQTSDNPPVLDERYMKLHGASNPDAWGCIEGYAFSRATPQSPDPALIPDPTDSWMWEIIASGNTQQTEALIEDLSDTNDDVPYDIDAYPGGSFNAGTAAVVAHQKFTASQTTGVVQQMNTGPFNAQCGLIRIESADITDETPILIEVTLVPGAHRGYLAQPMKDVN